jgi:hypothetical protein
MRRKQKGCIFCKNTYGTNLGNAIFQKKKRNDEQTIARGQQMRKFSDPESNLRQNVTTKTSS